MAQKRNEETDLEFARRNAFLSVLRLFPEDYEFTVSLSRTDTASYKEAKSTFEKYWGPAAQILKLLIVGGRKFGIEQGVGIENPLDRPENQRQIPRWWLQIPWYSEAKDKWDLLVANKHAVEHVLKLESAKPESLKTPLTNYYFNNRSTGDQYAKFINEADDGTNEIFLNLFDRVVLLMVHYNFLYTRGWHDLERPFAELMRTHLRVWAAGGRQNLSRVQSILNEVKSFPPPPGKYDTKEGPFVHILDVVHEIELFIA